MRRATGSRARDSDARNEGHAPGKLLRPAPEPRKRLVFPIVRLTSEDG